MTAASAFPMPTGYSLAASYYCLNASDEAGQDNHVVEAHKPSDTVAKPIENVPGDAVQVPRLPLSELNWKNRARFQEMMERHSFVVLTDLGENLERTHDQVLQDFETFFTSDDEDWKNGCTSKHVYLNEHGKPFWYAGYEHTSVRDCFRVACGDMSRLVWPSPEFEKHWLSLQRRMQRICDRALSLTVGYDIEPSNARTDKDFSVCYGLHYPNIEGSGQSETENVFEHVDPSLYVVEPVPSVEGLDVYDQHSKQWLKAEKVCVPGKEIVLFCGHALNRATKGRIPGTLHRVRRTPDRRFCIIYEQKRKCRSILTSTLAVAILANSLSQVKAYRISITTTPILESWEGWGTSLSWWADVFGDCEDIVDVLFSNLSSVSIDGAAKDIPALNFNIARYNIGGSGNNVIDDSGTEIAMKSSEKMPAFKAIESFWLDWTSTDPASKSWNWDADANQRAMLGLASKRGADVFEAYSNSPPWWMANNRATAGGDDGATENLKPEFFEQFAVYLATVVSKAKADWGIEFKYVAPFNEANSKVWTFPESQEACHLGIKTQSDILKLLRTQLDKLNLQNVLIAGAEEKKS
ncbi:hypothetical protein Pcac1_g25016 [Phytophthora cactorum]|nr:hypothetical protein Pcac1_g25016 [Phytophthora cactorum]KAG2848001.1 hypothetical protein PC111_g630 [Phytophthora cactorum]